MDEKFSILVRSRLLDPESNIFLNIVSRRLGKLPAYLIHTHCSDSNSKNLENLTSSATGCKTRIIANHRTIFSVGKYYICDGKSLSKTSRYSITRTRTTTGLPDDPTTAHSTASETFDLRASECKGR